MQFQQIQMTPSQWAEVADNPIQRDTERHAARAKHLLSPLAVHEIVFMAQLPSGDRVKLDGHTRSFLWKTGKVPAPKSLFVNIIPVQSIEEAQELYKTFDSKDAVETAPDKVSGALHSIGLVPTSLLLQQGFVANSLRVAWHVARGNLQMRRSVAMGYDIYEAAREYQTELAILDRFGLTPKQTSSGVTAAILISIRKHGEKVIPFWDAVFTNQGSKHGGKMDGPQAVSEMLLGKKTGAHGGSGAFTTCARCLSAVERWMKDETFTNMPRPLDLTEYLIGTRPAYQLRKKVVAKL